MLGDQSRALRIISKMKGWDPTKIEGGGDIANFDKSPDPIAGGDHTVGSLPQGTPMAFPEDHPNIGNDRIPFSTPDRGPGWDSKSRATKNSDPFAGFGGQ